MKEQQQQHRRRQWQPTPVLLSGGSHGWRSLVGCSPWGCEESDMTAERLHLPFSLSCIGEGNGNPLQYSCLENPREEGAWWAAAYEVAQSQTRLKRLSSSSSRSKGVYTLGARNLEDHFTVLPTTAAAVSPKIYLYLVIQLLPLSTYENSCLSCHILHLLYVT